MPLNTSTAAFNIAPVVIGTLVRHLTKKIKKRNIRDQDDTEAVDNLLFDEAFHIVKAFLELATRNTVEELQAYTNTYVPPPYWAEVVAATIPLSCCNRAADALISWFDPEELKRLVGGERWWQVRGVDGVQAEWVAMKKDWKELKRRQKRAADNAEKNDKRSKVAHYTERFDNLKKVLLYIPGGGFYFGSINTHRYQIIRFARKIGGRAFAVNYRKAPQYPWPCPLVDVLAAYFFLTHPPPGASHAAVDPNNIVVAGDSAGGSLCLSLLTVLRDLGLPLPAGAVLISPWVDLTHSFPSVMENTEKDIIPPHGFVHKPSTLWPLPTPSDRLPSNTTPDTPLSNKIETTSSTSNPAQLPGVSDSQKHDDAQRVPHRNEVDVLLAPTPGMKIYSQIQLYATNDQLTHPLVSPLLNGSLGGLCPLYILAGSQEVLRDEVLYLGHRAAYPEKYPLREGLMGASRQKESAEKFKEGTSVHLQIFDDMCHVLTVFSFTDSAAYAYRGISRFVKRVIDQSLDAHSGNPFPGSDLGNVSQYTSSSSEHVPHGAPSKQPGVVKRDFGKPPESGLNGDIQPAEVSGTDVLELFDKEIPDEPLVTQIILCERVDIRGRVRPMEHDIAVLDIAAGEVGIIKYAPVKRWQDGQSEADTKYKHRLDKIKLERAKHEAKAERLIAAAKEEGRLKDTETPQSPVVTEENEVQGDPSRRWGPLDLENENPPPSAIAFRRDTPDAIALLEVCLTRPPPSIHPTTERALPPHPIYAKINKAMHPRTAPLPIIQSASEVQRHSNKIPGSHGVRLWSGIMNYFIKSGAMSKEAAIAAKDKLVAVTSIHDTAPEEVSTPPKDG